jgi:hypothetical protein
VDSWLESPSLKPLAEAVDYWPHLKAAITAAKIAGPQVHDARIAALFDRAPDFEPPAMWENEHATIEESPSTTWRMRSALGALPEVEHHFFKRHGGYRWALVLRVLRGGPGSECIQYLVLDLVVAS